jgi:hypothetical protein
MEPNGSLGAGLTDDELFEIHSLVYDKVYYGDDEVVYRTTEEGSLIHDRLSSVLRKVDNEAKVRELWWGTA